MVAIVKLTGSIASLQFQFHKTFHGVPNKRSDALNLGVLSAAAISPVAVIYPAMSHSGFNLYAVAARDINRAAAFAKKHGFATSFGSYQALLDDPEVDVVYVPLPNSLHYEWASKALSAGKHVLVEKPFTSNAKEAKALVDQAADPKSVDKYGRKLVLLEAFHWRFHPAASLFEELLNKYGDSDASVSTQAQMRLAPAPADNDIRWKSELAGGSTMDCGYPLSFTRFALGALSNHSSEIISGEHLKVDKASAKTWKNDDQVDASMDTSLSLSQTVSKSDGTVKPRILTSKIFTDMSGDNVYDLFGLFKIPRFWDSPSISVTLPDYEIIFDNPALPHIFHSIIVRDRSTNRVVEQRRLFVGGPAWGSVQTTESENGSHGKGGLKSWSSYRYQLEAFEMKIRGEEPPVWISGQDSVEQMEVVDATYRASGLQVREDSAYLSNRTGA